MVRHIVFYRFSDKVNNSNMESVKNTICECVEDMKSAGIEGANSIEIAFNTLPGEPEVCLICEFADFDALKGFAVHETHDVLRIKTKDFCTGRIAFDYEY